MSARLYIETVHYSTGHNLYKRIWKKNPTYSEMNIDNFISIIVK